MNLICELGVSGDFGSKKITEKSAIFTKVLNYAKTSGIIFCPKMYQSFQCTYCLQKELTHLSVMVVTHFGLKVLGQFGMENRKQKNSNILKDFLNYTIFLMNNVYNKLSRNPHFTYYPNYLLLA